MKIKNSVNDLYRENAGKLNSDIPWGDPGFLKN